MVLVNFWRYPDPYQRFLIRIRNTDFLLNRGFELGQTEKLVLILGCPQSSSVDCVDAAERILVKLKQELGMQGIQILGRFNMVGGLYKKWNLQVNKEGNYLFFFSSAKSLILYFFK